MIFCTGVEFTNNLVIFLIRLFSIRRNRSCLDIILLLDHENVNTWCKEKRKKKQHSSYSADFPFN
jgi:hypothetical protein